MNSPLPPNSLPMQPQLSEQPFPSKSKKKIYITSGIILLVLTLFAIGVYLIKLSNKSTASNSDNLIDYSIPLEEDSRVVELPENTIRISKNSSSSAKPNPEKY